MGKSNLLGRYSFTRCLVWSLNQTFSRQFDGKSNLFVSQGNKLKCPRQLDSVRFEYYVQKYIHEIVHNSSTSITSLFNTKSAYRQEEIDEIRTKWAAFFYMEVYAGISGILVCIAGELVIRFTIE
uniref:Uncharacterized protein n=1 Tax=Cucumis melo TaxID=3656 RepID=A0A9I9E7T9_CUCME